VTVTTACTLPSDYDVFAPHYDAFTSGSDYERWTEVVLEHARAHGLRGTTMLDIACGTGNSFVPFLRRGFRVVGCDASAGMLAEAARKAPRARLVLADMRELPTLGEFDLVTCFDDSLNYLDSEAELAAAFTSIAANLAPAGLALLDLNSLQAYRTTFARDQVNDDAEGRVFVWRGETAEHAAPGCGAEAWIDVFVPAGEGLYRRVRSRHAQRHFARDRVTALLRKAGLELLGVNGVGDDGALAADADELRHLKVLYTTRRAKGGAANDHQEDRQAGASGHVNHQAVVTDRGSARPANGLGGPPHRGERACKGRA
jgi:SAM-dependent methyltransferase